MAQSAVVDFASIQGNLKTIAAGYENAIPKEYMICKDFPFEEGNKVGDEYQYGVELTRPQGFTTAAPGTFPELNAPVARQAPKARLQPFQMYLRERISYDVLSRAGESKQAFKTEIGATVEAMRDSMMFRQEVLSLYGQAGLGIIGTITSATDTITLTSQSWAAGIWAGSENMPLSIRSADGTAYNKDVTVRVADLDNLSLQLNSGDTAGLVVGQTIWFQGGSPTSELLGAQRLIQNTGLLYNINGAEYSLWRGNTLTLGANEDLGFRRCIQLEARIRARGGMGDQSAFVSADVFTTLINTIEAARDFGGQKGPSGQYDNVEMDRGTRTLKYFSPVGVTTVRPHPIVKRGDYFSLRKGKFFRAGATDPTFDIPGTDGKIMTDLQDFAAKEIRAMANNTWFSPRPAALGYINNITFGGTVLTA